MQVRGVSARTVSRRRISLVDNGISARRLAADPLLPRTVRARWRGWRRGRPWRAWRGDVGVPRSEGSNLVLTESDLVLARLPAASPSRTGPVVPVYSGRPESRALYLIRLERDEVRSGSRFPSPSAPPQPATLPARWPGPASDQAGSDTVDRIGMVAAPRRRGPRPGRCTPGRCGPGRPRSARSRSPGPRRWTCRKPTRGSRYRAARGAAARPDEPISVHVWLHRELLGETYSPLMR